jgi:ornithine cyclodeaminase
VVRVLGRDEVRRLVSMADAIAAVREAFAAADRGGAVMPAPFGMRLPEAGGEVHVKGAYLTGAPVFAVKTATGFYRNAGDELTVADLTGLGIQDAAVAALAARLAGEHGAGRDVPLGDS